MKTKIRRRFGARDTGRMATLLALSAFWGASLVGAKQIDWVEDEATTRRLTVDFDNGHQAGREPRPTNLAGVLVEFSTTSPGGAPSIAKVSNAMPEFLGKGETPDASLGKFFLTTSSAGVGDAFGYAINFSEEVANLTLDGFDFRADDGGAIGDIVTLNAFDSMNRLIGSDAYTITGRELDGNILTFGVNAPGIRRVELMNSGLDVSTGIDNISFDIGVSAAPEPAEWAMIGIGALILGVAYRRR